MKLEIFGNLEEVICVAEHDFELGSEPLLRREEFEGVFVNELGLLNHIVDLFIAFGRKKDKDPQWKMPVIKKGRFVRGRGSMS